jgi:hypothetical protein
MYTGTTGTGETAMYEPSPASLFFVLLFFCAVENRFP